jgi:hypothetical protein
LLSVGKFIIVLRLKAKPPELNQTVAFIRCHQVDGTVPPRSLLNAARDCVFFLMTTLSRKFLRTFSSLPFLFVCVFLISSSWGENYCLMVLKATQTQSMVV